MIKNQRSLYKRYFHFKPATAVATLALATCCTHSHCQVVCKICRHKSKMKSANAKANEEQCYCKCYANEGANWIQVSKGERRGVLRSSVCACAEAAESKRSGKLGVNFYWRQLDVGCVVNPLDSAWNFMLLLLLLWTGTELGSQFSHYLIVVTGVKPLKWSLPRQTDWMGFIGRERGGEG